MFKHLQVDPTSHVPVSLQLKEQLKHLVLSGGLSPGLQLPSVRQLAGFLRINRNTVVRAFAELELEGLVRTHHGKGVFVTDRLPDTAHALLMQRFVRESLRLATTLNLSLYECATTLLACAQLGDAAILEPPLQAVSAPRFNPDETTSTAPDDTIRLLLLECNDPVLRLYKRDLEAALPVHVDAVLTDDLPDYLANPHVLSSYTLAVTTFFHIEEVEAQLSPWGLRSIALLAEASLATLFRLMGLAPQTCVGLICENHAATENMHHSMERADLTHLNVVKAALSDSDALNDVFQHAAVIVTSVDCADPVQELAPEVDLIIEDGRIDRGALDLLRRFLGL